MSGISVIIPTYNRSLLIGETLRSILNQSISADEIIVVDDGSSDDTSNAAITAFEEWKGGNVKGTKVPEFKVIGQENAGPAKARNTGFAASKGEFIHFFDSDDLAVPNKHEVQLKALEENGADIAYGPWVKGKIGEGKFTPESHVIQQYGVPHGQSTDLIKELLCRWSIVTHACLFRRSIVEKSGLFPEHLFSTEDQKMFLRCLLIGAKVIHTPGTLELYRTNVPSKITATGYGQKRLIYNWGEFLREAYTACNNDGIDPGKWFGFRRRVWESILDLEKFGILDQDLHAGLHELLRDGGPASFYRIHRGIERKWMGLKFRITGGRTNSSFKSGPITKEQKHLIEKMGLHLEGDCASFG